MAANSNATKILGNQVTGTTGTTSTNLVYSGTPTLATPLMSSYTDFTGTTTPATPSAGISRLYSQLGVDGVARMSVKSPAGFDLTIFRDAVQRVYNPTGSTITKGSPVYIVGTNLNVPSVNNAKADSTSTNNVAGIMISDATAGAYGTMQLQGLAQGLDTSAFNVGDDLFLSATIAGGLVTPAPTKPNFAVQIGRVTVKDASIGSITLDIRKPANLALDNLTDVSATTPALDDMLSWNGSVWTNTPPFSAGSSPGVIFYNATPVINAVTQPGGISQDGTSGNGIQINSLSKTPITTAEQTAAGTAVSDTRAFASWLYNTALGRTTIDAGIWNFTTYAAVNSVAAGRVTTLTRALYQVVPVSSGTVTITGAGANTRTATITSGQFTGTYFAPSATNTVASYLQTPAGIFQITASGTTNTATITVPTGYVNESAVTFNIWNKLFGATSPTITSTGTNYTAFNFLSTQGAFTVAATDKLGAISFVTSNNTTTLTLTYNGTTHNTHIESPLITLHNNLAGLQGGTANEYYHLTSTEYTGSGTGAFARVSSPVFTTPNIGSATGSVSGNAGSATTIGITDDTATNATMYPLWVTANTGNLPAKVSSTKLSFNPSTGDLTLAGVLSPGGVNSTGALIGNSLSVSLSGNPLTATNTVDNASVQAGIFQGTRATQANNDNVYTSFQLKNSTAGQSEFGRIGITGTNITTSSEDGRLEFSVKVAGAMTTKTELNGVAFSPFTSDGLALGNTVRMWSDLFLASGGVINWNNGNATLTHSTGLLTSNVPLSLGTSNALTAGTIELGHATDTTIARVSAGVISVEGVTVPTISSTSTLTNKRIDPRIVSAASYTTDTGTSLDISTCDIFVITAQAGALKFNNPGGTPVQGDKLIIRIKDNGTARALTYDTQFRASSDLALPSTTVLSKTLYMGFIYNSTDTKWDLLAVLNNF